MAVSVPHAKKVFHEVTMHGDTRVDFYHWLRGKHPEDWKAMLDDTSLLDKEVRTYLEAENAYYKDHIAEFNLKKTMEITKGDDCSKTVLAQPIIFWG